MERSRTTGAAGLVLAKELHCVRVERDATILRLKTLDDPPERTLEVMRRNGWLAKGA